MTPPRRSTPTADADDEEQSLAGAWLASIAVAGLAAAALSGAYVLTPGAPECRLYGASGWVLCPWYRRYVATAAALLLALGAGMVGVGLLAGLVRRAVG